MFWYNLIIKIYDTVLKNRKWLPKRFFSPIRYVYRAMANKVLPKVLKRRGKYSDVIASDWLRQHNENKKLIVSFTSFPKRINHVWKVVASMKYQTIRPDMIILYLSNEQFKTMDEIPASLLDQVDDIFKIKLVPQDLRSYKKFKYAFEEYPDDIVMLMDDDVFYPLDNVEVMLKAHIRYPDDVICRYALPMEYDEEGHLKSYRSWEKPFYGESHENNLFLVGIGTTLFQPNRMHSDTCNESLFMKLAPLADDIWLNVMARKSGLKIFKAKMGNPLSISIPDSESLLNVNVLENKNDEQFKNVLEYYKMETI